jgi:hypothetical protein
MNEDDGLRGTLFRWSLRKIRTLSVGVGAGLGIAIGVYVVFDIFFGHRPSIHTPLQDAAAGFAIAALGGVGIGAGVAVILLIGRACSKTVITADDLFVQRALWHRNFVKWSEILSAQRRDMNGWRYIYMKTPSTFLEVGLSIEVDDPRGFAAEIARYTQPGHPLRAELFSAGILTGP